MQNETTLDPEIIEAVHNFLQDGGKATAKNLAPITGGKENVQEYLDGVIAKYPDIYEKKENTDEVPPQTEAPVETTYKLLNDKGLLETLAVVSSKPGKVVLKIETPPEPRDEVTIMYRGTPTVVDLHQVRKNNQSPLEGLSAQAVLVMGEAARA